MDNVPLAGARVSLDVDDDASVEVRGLPLGIQLDTAAHNGTTVRRRWLNVNHHSIRQ
jgi:hypothetical protein